MYTITCIVMPLLGFKVYNYENYLARIFVKYMLVSESVYYGFALPAVILFVFAITFPINNRQIADSGDLFMLKMRNIKRIINKDKRPGRPF